PIDVTKSGWLCTLENGAMRVGMRYVKGMRESVARAIVEERTHTPFTSIDDLGRRVRELQKRELILLAEVGALNTVGALREAQARQRAASRNERPGGHIPPLQFHRRDALWQVERACRRTGPLLEPIEEQDVTSPLAQMTSEERQVADFHGTGMTVGPHP